MALPLADDLRAALADALIAYFATEFDEPLSAFRAEQLTDFIVEKFGPALHHAGVQDARAYLQQKLDDLETDLTL